MAETISVASKLPIGLTLEHAGKKVTFFGANHPEALLGCGITPNVDKAWFDDMAETLRHPAIENGHVFPNTAAKIRDEVKEKADDDTLKTGLEAIDPSKPQEVVPGIEPDTTNAVK
jgi:hypothetical protein